MEGPQLKAPEVQRAARARMAPRQASLSTSHVPVGGSGTRQAARALFLQGWGVHGEQGLFGDLSHGPAELAQESGNQSAATALGRHAGHLSSPVHLWLHCPQQPPSQVVSQPRP